MSSSIVTKIKVRQIRSATKRKKDQAATLLGLGLKHIRDTRILEKTPSIMGMVIKVQHLVEYEDIDERNKS